MIEMPILRPVPIPTKGLSFWKRIGVWRHTTRKWELMENFNYDGYTIPGGFVFDGASVPRCLWWFLSPVGLLLIPGILHDYRYMCGDLNRSGYDELFRWDIKVVTGTTVIPWIAYFAVRLGGGRAWRRHRKND